MKRIGVQSADYIDGRSAKVRQVAYHLVMIYRPARYISLSRTLLFELLRSRQPRRSLPADGEGRMTT